MTTLPIEAIRPAFDRAIADHRRAVVSAPTGSGKSTRVPVWLAEGGRVLVVEPRRVACHALAQRVGELESARWGSQAVAYTVRRANTMTKASRIVFATPGVVLQWLAKPDEAPGFDAVVVDEFHERTLQTDLIVALLNERFNGPLVIMSATVEAERIATYLNGPHLHGQGRLHDVAVRYATGNDSRDLLPSSRDLDVRIGRALAGSWEESSGDVLVFLPGKGEISAVARHIGGLRLKGGAEVVPLHGGLTLRQQSRVFAPAKHRKIVVATNVAETSLTVPGIGVVIDSGLVRRTRYHGGRGVLTLAPIAEDSATQRAGRAGRTRDGICIRLWSEAAKLRPTTPPEVARESLAPLVLAAANAKADVRALTFLDPPAEHAVQTARQQLLALGALDDADLTPVGQQLARLPLDPALGRLLVEGVRHGDHTAVDVVDLVSALSVRGHLFRSTWAEDGDLRSCGDDALAAIAAVRSDKGRPEVHADVREEVLKTRQELGRLMGLTELVKGPPTSRQVDVKALKMVVMRALSSSVFVQRKRKAGRGREVAWGGPGVEVTLGRDSVVDPDTQNAICALSLHASGDGRRAPLLRVSSALRLTYRDLAAAGFGEESVAKVELVGSRINAVIERRYGGRVIGTREESPRGNLAREALATLMLRRRVFAEAVDAAERDLRRWSLARRLASRRLIDPFESAPQPTPTLEVFIAERLSDLGFEDGDDVALLEAQDFAAGDLPEEVARRLARDYPTEALIGGTRFVLDYALATRTVTLEVVGGDARKPPSASLIPRLRGFRVEWLARGKRRVIRAEPGR